MKESVHDLCRCCQVCAHRKGNRKHAPMRSIKVGSPFERVGMEIVGPLQTTSRGNRYILRLVEDFTMNVEAYPLESKEASAIALVLINEFIARFGVPRILLSN